MSTEITKLNLVHHMSTVETMSVKVKLDDEAILESIKSALASRKVMNNFKIKSITFKVPGGGDWSNMEIDLNDMEFDVVLVREFSATGISEVMDLQNRTKSA